MLLPAAPITAQQVLELGFHAVATGSDPLFGGGGLYGASRVSDRTRIAATLSGGVAGADAEFRGELLGHFLLSPRKGRGIGLYALGGAALVAGPASEGYLVLGLGAEARPGAQSGWSLEAGVGGGFRVALGYRWRWFPRGWVPEK
jgi:hypothetical protein